MNKELALRTFAYLIGHYKTNNETTINKQEIEAMEFILKDNESLEQQCKKQKEYNQHLHNLNNTIFRELLNKKYENKKQKEVINEAIAIYDECIKTQDFSTCDLEMYLTLKEWEDE